MPVAFNPPPLPTHDAIGAVHKTSTRDEGDDDAFAAILSVANLGSPIESAAVGPRKIESIVPETQSAEGIAAAPAVVCLLPTTALRNEPALSAFSRGHAPVAKPITARETPAPAYEVAKATLDGANPLLADTQRNARILQAASTPRRDARTDDVPAARQDMAPADAEPTRGALVELPGIEHVEALAKPAVPAPLPMAATSSDNAQRPSERITQAAPLTKSPSAQQDAIRLAAATEAQAAVTASAAPVAAAVASSPHAAAMAVAALAAPGSAHVPTASNEIAAPVGTPAWAGEAAQKIAHVVIGRSEGAELRVHPAELGPIDIRVDLKSDHATVNIIAAHPETRQALEQALPQLRELLAQGGITLSQASVHDGAAQRQDAQPDRARTAIVVPDAAPSSGQASAPATTTQSIVERLVDVFA